MPKELVDYLWNHIAEKSFPELLIDDEFRVRTHIAVLMKAIVSSDREGKGKESFEKIRDMLL